MSERELAKEWFLKGISEFSFIGKNHSFDNVMIKRFDKIWKKEREEGSRNGN